MRTASNTLEVRHILASTARTVMFGSCSTRQNIVILSTSVLAGSFLYTFYSFLISMWFLNVSEGHSCKPNFSGKPNDDVEVHPWLWRRRIRDDRGSWWSRLRASFHGNWRRCLQQCWGCWVASPFPQSQQAWSFSSADRLCLNSPLCQLQQTDGPVHLHSRFFRWLFCLDERVQGQSNHSPRCLILSSHQDRPQRDRYNYASWQWPRQGNNCKSAWYLLECSCCRVRLCVCDLGSFGCGGWGWIDIIGVGGVEEFRATGGVCQ